MVVREVGMEVSCATYKCRNVCGRAEAAARGNLAEGGYLGLPDLSLALRVGLLRRDQRLVRLVGGAALLDSIRVHVIVGHNK